ncbi:Clp protease N-terminal domain-containing protein [Umezawaea sp. Da 62-37]|uniref:Clp protease N-terminal domain-containing protein n=1 Tax=Umezawaea sp. Da 62-37 TaxID=3075927 RepID=UPI0028F6ED6E|nr:Clp protease N-terminal domain-containing protein [Umezawaea sp. Da 62-37]WNV84271.1 Clp protease N-terminal domain-containing protein [Umezawaea sp. Da 62-37]
MPKINVYLPDELADAVKESGVPVSAICQRALEQSVKRVTAIRATVLGDLEVDDPTAGLTHFTDRARAAVKLGVGRAREEGAGVVSSGHLLHGLLAEGTNLGLRVLQAVEVDPGRVGRELGRLSSAGGGGEAARFGGDAANALELTVVEAVTLGHNYVGCEHLLLGLIAEPDGLGGQALRAAGAELRLVRGAVVAALAGYVHLRAQPQSEALIAGGAGAAGFVAEAVRKEIEPLVGRLDRLEARVGVEG